MLTRTAERPHPIVGGGTKGLGYVGPGLRNIQSGVVSDPQQVHDISYVRWELGTKMWTARTTAVVPPLQFVQNEKRKRCAGELVDLDHVVRMDERKIQNTWYEDVDLEPLETRLVATGAPVQDPVQILGVFRLDSVETIVFLAESLLDGLRTARVGGDTKDVEVLVRAVGGRVDVHMFV